MGMQKSYTPLKKGEKSNFSLSFPSFSHLPPPGTFPQTAFRAVGAGPPFLGHQAGNEGPGASTLQDRAWG